MSKFNKFLSRENGFTLIEVVVALAILAIGIVALLGAHRSALAHQQKALNRMIAVELAEEKLSEVRSLIGTFPSNGEKQSQNKLFYWTTQKRTIQPGLAEWEVVVRWGNSQSNEVNLTTWIRE